MFKMDIQNIVMKIEFNNYIYILRKIDSKLLLVEVNMTNKDSYFLEINDDNYIVYGHEKNKYTKEISDNIKNEFIDRIKNIVYVFYEIIDVDKFNELLSNSNRLIKKRV